MTLIDRVAYRVAQKFTLALMEAHDYAGWFGPLQEDIEGIKFEELDEFLGVLEADKNANKAYEYAGVSKLRWFYDALTAIRNVKFGIWMAKYLKRREERSNGG